MSNIQSLERAFFLLEFLASAGSGGLSLTELSHHGGLKLPTCRNLLATLQSLGYVRQLPGNRRYTLTGKGIFPDATDFSVALSSHVRPLLQSLLAAVGETIVFCLYLNHQRRTLLALESQQQLKVAATSGWDKNFYSTATGRILLSLLSDSELSSLLRHLPSPTDGWPEFSDSERRPDLLSEIRQDGRVLLRKSSLITALAVPVPLTGRPHAAALGMYYPAARHPDSRTEEFFASLQAVSQQITAFAIP